MGTLEQAIELAARAHAGQDRKDGAPFIVHPLRMALPFIRAGDEDRAIVALLHDVVEKSDWSLKRLRAEGFDAAIVDAIDALSRRDGEPYLDFVRRAAADPLARPVKRADLRDNLATIRATEREDRDDLVAKYEAGLAVLDDLAAGDM